MLLAINKKADDIQENAVIIRDVRNTDGTTKLSMVLIQTSYFLVNTSGKVIDSKSKNKDGNDYQFVVAKGGKLSLDTTLRTNPRSELYN